MKWLLDNNVLIAAIATGHPHHEPSRAWLDTHKVDGWAVTVETYLGVIRALMNPVIMKGNPLETRLAVDAVKDEVLGGDTPARIVHVAPNSTILYKAQGHRQIMDLHLITTALEYAVKVVTRDNGILAAFPTASHNPAG